tara:strand:+ start:827 stop:1078 length:252 start_codon:yes stop_codon:yes gene_type:complete
MSGTVETVITNINSNKDLLEISKPIPFKKTTSFEKMYNEYLITCKDKSVELSNSNFNPDDQNSPNVFVNKLENRIKLYYNSFK